MDEEREVTPVKKKNGSLKLAIFSIVLNLALIAGFYFYQQSQKAKKAELKERIEQLETELANKDGAIDELRSQLDEFQY